jgi:hypothetical protein
MYAVNASGSVAAARERLALSSYPTVDMGTAPSALPHALPAPWPGQS